MEFINHTPFGAAAYRALDTASNEHEVVVLRTEYRLAPVRDAAAGITWLVPTLVDDPAAPLVIEDRLRGAADVSGVRSESDLAPFKPRCDVLLAGHAHAPRGVARPSWLARLRVSAPSRDAGAAVGSPGELDALPPPAGAGLNARLAWQQFQAARERQAVRRAALDGHGVYRLLVDKTLRVHGPRRFIRSGDEWHLEPGDPALQVPIAWELAYGGRCWLGPDRQEVNYRNPLGCGWWHAGWQEALAAAGAPLPDALPAPQWEPTQAPITEPDFTAQAGRLAVAQMAEAARHYAHEPAGFGALGRAWTPRIQKAGTYDDIWRHGRWPQLPRDFDMAYWCGAPADQQIDGFLPPDAVIELGHLVAPAQAPSGHAAIELPGHRPWVLLRTVSGLLLGAEPVIDTVLVDTDALTLALTWRASVRADMGVQMAELGFHVDPAQPLFTLRTEPVESAAALGHG